jgi:hypothetical protein
MQNPIPNRVGINDSAASKVTLASQSRDIALTCDPSQAKGRAKRRITG